MDPRAIDTVRTYAIQNPEQIIIVSNVDRHELHEFPSVVAGLAGNIQRYAGEYQEGIPRRKAEEHYLKTHFACDAVIISLHKSRNAFPGAAFQCWLQGYDSLCYIFVWINELKQEVGSTPAS